MNRACANCCKVAETDITKRDAARISRKMGMSEKEFVGTYTTASAFDDEMILRPRRGLSPLSVRTGVYGITPATTRPSSRR